ncbi:hypothetical protein ABZ547_40490 [Streptomyces sparsogenes]|uniref:hypothetical protein n=1 Tax=Streptomyces sparsogenes TaxID=67365 RepID=UPI0033ED4027
MTEQRTDRPDAPRHDASPWWWGLGPVGGALLVVAGVLAGAWVFLELPGAPGESATGYYGAARVVAIGLVVGGGALLGRGRARGARAEGAEGTRERGDG